MLGKKAILTLGRAPEWLEVVQNLRRELGWNPCYWITVRHNHEAVLAKFPEAVAHDFVDLNRCLPAPGIQLLNPGQVLDVPTLEEFGQAEAIAMDMMDRMDLGGSFTHAERQQAYLWQLAYWLTVVERMRPDIAVFNVPPHSPGEFVMYSVCKRRGVDVRVFLPTPVAALHLVSDAYDRLPANFVGAYERRLASADLSISPPVRAQLESMRQLDASPPWYVIEGRKREERRSGRKLRLRRRLNRDGSMHEPLRLGVLVPTRPESLPNPADEEPIRRVYKRPGAPLSAPVLTKGEYKRYLRWAYRRKIELEDCYANLAAAPDLSVPYVFLALHYQPERTTCPDGGRYNNQFLVAALISAALPEGWRLYVKEHPAQFHYRNNGEQARSSDFYRALAALSNVTLVPLETESAELVGKARAVATVTGVVGWEALLRQVPVLVFGAAWYRACRGVYTVDSNKDATEALARIGAGERPALEEVLAYAGALEDVGVTCYTNTSLAPAVEIDYRGQVSALTAALAAFERGTSVAADRQLVAGGR